MSKGELFSVRRWGSTALRFRGGKQTGLMGSVCVWIAQANVVKCPTNRVKGVHLSVCLRLTSPLRLLQGESTDPRLPQHARTHGTHGGLGFP